MVSEACDALVGEDLMHAVARGAAYYGLARQGKGVRVRGGVPRSYYVGRRKRDARRARDACAAKGSDGGAFRHGGRHGAQIPGSRVRAERGGARAVPLLPVASRKDDAPGSMLEDLGPDLEEFSPVEISLPGTPGKSSRDIGSSGDRDGRAGVVVRGAQTAAAGSWNSTCEATQKSRGHGQRGRRLLWDLIGGEEHLGAR